MRNYAKALLFVGVGVLLAHFAPWALTLILCFASVVFIKVCLDGMES